MSTPKTVKVLYKFVDGAHFFVSDDKETIGLCVAHKDLETAFNAVAPTLTKLFRENHQEEMTFTPRMSLAELQDWLNQQMGTPIPSPAGGIPWQEMAMAA